MPVTLSKIANNTASVTFAYAGESVTVDYFPAKVTERTFAQIQSFAGLNMDTVAASFGSFNEVLASLIKSWDVYEDEDQLIMFPVTPDRLAELPIAFRLEVLQAILGDIRPEAIAPTAN